MSTRTSLVGLCAVATITVAGAQGQPRQGQPTFTASTDVVMVDVSVRKGGRQVTGLSAADFELRDNGVKQDVETVESEAVAIDLSILIDVSANPMRPWVKLPAESAVAAGVVERTRQLTRLLRSGDRVRLFALDTYIQQLWPLQGPDSAPAVNRVAFDGMPSLYDSLLTLLLQPTEPRRRHVIVAETKGLDAVSVTNAADLRQIAARTDAQAHLVMMERKADEEATVAQFQFILMSLRPPTYRFWRPGNRRLFFPSATGIARGPITDPSAGTAPEHPLTPDGQALRDGADATGGGLYQTVGLSEPNLLNTFEKAFENFRQSYILRYTPKGVTRAGWHEITVTVPKDRSVQIRSRNGYSIETSAAAPPVAPPIPPNTLLRTPAEVERAFDEGSFELVRRSLRQIPEPAKFIAEFEARGIPWPANPRLEAVLALEVAEAGLFAQTPAARDQGATILRRLSRLVRDPISPDPFEREWLVAAARMLQGLMRPAMSQIFVDAAIQRFPDDGRLRMARAVISDQRWPLAGTIGTVPEITRTIIPASHAATVIAEFENVAAYPELRAEAEIRHGWFLHRIGRSADALAKIESAKIDPGDRALAYLRELLMGQVLQALDRGPDALAAFRRAVSLVPGAQSARVALMNALLMAGDRAQAEALATELQSSPATLVDPWWLYWQGDYRRYPESLARLRVMMR